MQPSAVTHPDSGLKSPQPILVLRREVRESLCDVALVALQHFLPSIVPLFERFIEAGLRPDRVFLLGKPYSTVPATAAALTELGCYVHSPPERFFTVDRRYADSFRMLVTDYWSAVEQRLPPDVRRLIILDEGGWLYRELPDALAERLLVTGVEHTMYGLINAPDGHRQEPFVIMAASAAKTRFESPVIAEAIVERLSESIPELAQLKVGVVGLGNIGQAVARALLQRDVTRLVGHDSIREKGDNIKGLEPVSRADVLGSDVILGCTGTDSLAKGAPFHSLKEEGSNTVRRRWLASCSSGDVEFLYVAKQLASRVQAFRTDPFRDVRGEIGKTEITLLNGGFPLNFDRVRERERPARIQLTREITYAAVLQAALCLDPTADTGEIMFDADIQQQLVEAWLSTEADRQPHLTHWTPHPVEWWEKHSRGQRPTTRALADFIQVHPSLR